jgi:hypothetical protein
VICQAYSIGVREEGTVDGVHDTQFRERLHDEVHHDTDDDEANQDGSRSTAIEGRTRSDEETSANGTAWAWS